LKKKGGTPSMLSVVHRIGFWAWRASTTNLLLWQLFKCYRAPETRHFRPSLCRATERIGSTTS
jgi:hypothetical protein